MFQPTLPVCCNPVAFDLLSRSVGSISSLDGLLNGAVAISQHQMPKLNEAAVNDKLQAVVNSVRANVRVSTNKEALLAQVHELLFGEGGYSSGLSPDTNAGNFYLPNVLSSKQGSVWVVSLIYKVVCGWLGIPVRGIDLQVTMLCSVTVDKVPMIINALAQGKLVTVNEIQEWMDEWCGPQFTWSDKIISAPFENASWLGKITQGLIGIFEKAGRWSDVAAMLEMQMLLYPSERSLDRDLGRVLAQAGRPGPAAKWLSKYIEENLDYSSRFEDKQLLAKLEEKL